MRGLPVVSVMTAMRTIALSFVSLNVSAMANSVSPLSIASSMMRISGDSLSLRICASPSGIYTIGVSDGAFIFLQSVSITYSPSLIK